MMNSKRGGFTLPFFFWEARIIGVDSAPSVQCKRRILTVTGNGLTLQTRSLTDVWAEVTVPALAQPSASALPVRAFLFETEFGTLIDPQSGLSEVVFRSGPFRRRDT